jgi:hypothetical protein
MLVAENNTSKNKQLIDIHKKNGDATTALNL